MATDKMEWVEIIEPKTKEHMYANLTTGECVWDPPTGVPVKKTDNKQWWELFDHNTGRFYYYNATSQKTVWHRPANCDIIPLAKLQTLKQNTEPANTDDGTPNNDVSSTTSSHKSKESVATQTPGGGGGGGGGGRSSIRHAAPTSNVKINNCMSSKGGANGSGSGGAEAGQNSPRSGRPHHHHHHHRHGHQDSCRAGDGRGRRGSQGSWRRNTHAQDSGRSSDSSSVSLCRHQSAAAAIPTDSQQQQQQLAAAVAVVRSGAGLGVGAASDSSSPAGNKPSLAPSPSTPLLKKRSPSQSIKANSFDINISVGGGYSLGQENRSGGRPPQRILTGSASNHGIARSHSFAQKQSQATCAAATPAGVAGGGQAGVAHVGSLQPQQHNDDEEDSMHEKYFLSGRRSADSPMDKDSTSKNVAMPRLSPDYANFSSTLPQKITQETSTRHTREPSSDLDDMNGLSFPAVWGTASLNRKNDNNTDTGSKRSEQQSGGGGLDNRSSGGSGGGNSTADSWAAAAATQLQPHILPLHHYILEQAKLSGCYRFGGLPEETDSLNSDDDDAAAVAAGVTGGGGRSEAGGAGGGGVGRSRHHHHRSRTTAAATMMDYDSDEFADDEAVQDDDSSSQECCLDDDDDDDDEEEDEDDPPYINTNASRFSDHHYSDAADYTDTLQPGSDIASSLYCNTRMSQHTVRPTIPPNTTTPPATGWSYKREGMIPLETQHTSLKRIREPAPPQPPVLYSPILERSEFGSSARRHLYHRQRSFDYPQRHRSDDNRHRHQHHQSIGGGGDHHHHLQQQHQQGVHHRHPQDRQPSPLMMMAQSLPSSPSPMSASYDAEKLSRLGLNRERKLPSESDIEKYAQDNLNVHKKGIFRKKFSIRELLSWSKDPIRKPMLVLSDKNLKKEATEVFRMVQTYMGDRKGKQGGAGQESVLVEMATLAHANPALRDELYIQICRQTTENPRRDSLIKGWELMAICLYFFPPSPKFQAYLESYMNRHRDPSYEHFPEVGKWPIHVQVSHYASVACKRLQRIGAGGKRPIRKPTLDEIEQAKIQIFRPSMFGSTLEEVMEMQKSRFPHYKLPWVQTTLSDEVLRLQGIHTEGIFRVSADVDEVTSLKQQLDRWDRPTEYTDAHTPASLLKLWYRELYEPLIPDSLYEECIQQCDDAEQAAAIVDTLPHLNKMVLAYLIRFLQIFARPEVVAVTKMDASNLAMVMAPNCLRCCCQEPRVMYENARKEMAFIRTLILSMDTAFMQGVL